MDDSLQTSKTTRKKIDISKYVFIGATLIIPVACFIVFYLVVNFNSIVMAFQRFDLEKEEYVWGGLENFNTFFELIKSEDKLRYAFRNSAITLLLNLCISLPLCLFVSYCIMEKLPFFGFFKVVLFLPSIISAYALVMVGEQVITQVLPEFFDIPDNVLTGGREQFITITIYSLFIGFSGNMVLYIGGMSSVSKDIMEYSRIDGCGFMRRFIYVVLPAIWPTITTMMITLFTHFFVSYGSFFSFLDQWAEPESYTLGYYLYVMIYRSTQAGGATSKAQFGEYPLAAAMGVAFTLIAIPIVFGVRWAMTKFGPKEE